MRAGLTAILVAFFAFGFFAASLLSVFWLLVIVTPSAFAALMVAVLQGTPLLHAVGLGAAAFALAQIGYGLGLLRIATLRNRYIPD